MTDLAGELSAIATSLREITVGVRDGKRGAGSGVLWDDGLVVTNAHVVEGKRPVVALNDGSRVTAQLVARNATLDLAALQLETAPARETASVRDATGVRPGELAFAVGHPLGVAGAVTAGLVQRANARWVMADVRLAPGNSGGPLADAQGRVIGINSMIAGNLAFAVSSTAVRAFLREDEGERFGVAVTPVRLNATTPGLLVTDVADKSVAEEAGILWGDTIVAIDGHGVATVSDLAYALRAAARLEVVRGGRRSLVEVKRELRANRAA